MNQLTPADHRDEAEQAREQAAEYREKADAIEDLQDKLRGADSVGETPLSGLFHEARTSSKDNWKAATAFIQVTNTGALVETVEKISEGVWPPETRRRWDVLLSVPIRPFMDAETFRSLAIEGLDQSRASFIQSAQRSEQEAATHDHLAERTADDDPELEEAGR